VENRAADVKRRAHSFLTRHRATGKTGGSRAERLWKALPEDARYAAARLFRRTIHSLTAGIVRSFSAANEKTGS
jgi:hypothetical protein